MNKALAEVADLVRRETGMAMPDSMSGSLRHAIDRAAPGLGVHGLSKAARDPAGNRELIDRLIDEVTIQETAFLRDREQLDVIAWHSLRASGWSGAGGIRVWSTACASGEEVYTLALLAAEAFAPELAPVDVLGTDVSPAALTAAKAGRYRERSVRALGPELRRRYFERQGDGSYIVAERLRRLVRFRRHNLVRDQAPPPGEDGFDVVVCRNVLIYFTAPVARQVVGKLERSLAPAGILVLGAADALQRTAGDQPPGPPPSPRVTRPSEHRTAPVASPPSRDERLRAAVRAADIGDRQTALALVTSLIADDPLDAEAQFIHGLVALEAGDPGQAAVALRRALYADSRFAVAAFALGRAYDAQADFPAARRAYEQALRTLDPDDDRHHLMLAQIHVDDIAAACRVRLGGEG